LVNGKKGRREKGERRRGILHTPTMKQPVISTKAVPERSRRQSHVNSRKINLIFKNINNKKNIQMRKLFGVVKSMLFK